MTRRNRPNEVDPAEQLRTWLAIYGDNPTAQPSERASGGDGDDEEDARQPQER
ncbi:hypothetical protein GCM10009554_20030 [Kribbella koreensis]|uniref:Uncharacterized protein n=1 Tax=Kribbella koreensis TaxID=57909 RepID=A0ABN1PW38_9ACTN